MHCIVLNYITSVLYYIYFIIGVYDNGETIKKGKKILRIAKQTDTHGQAYKTNKTTGIGRKTINETNRQRNRQTPTMSDRDKVTETHKRIH